METFELTQVPAPKPTITPRWIVPASAPTVSLLLKYSKIKTFFFISKLLSNAGYTLNDF